MKYQQDRAWMEISLDAIEENYRRICGFIGPDRQIMAVIPLGFADGIRRSIAGQVPFLLHGKRVPILGKICMDYTTLDVTDIPEAQEGDLVTVFGEDGGLSFQSYELAACYPGSVGELTSILSPRIPRFYPRKGKIVGRLDE